jgi:hypothetical protein
MAKPPRIGLWLLEMPTQAIAKVNSANRWIAEKFNTTNQIVFKLELGALGGFGFTMIQIGESAAAIAIWFLLLSVLLIKVLAWKGFQGKQGVTSFLRSSGVVGTLFLFFLLTTVTTLHKPENEPWSNLLKLRQAHAVASPLPQVVMQELEDIDHFVGGKNEYQLDELFAWNEMKEENIRIIRDRLIEFKKTGHIPLWGKYSALGDEVLYSTETGSFYQKGGGHLLIAKPNEVAGVLLPHQYVKSKSIMEQFKGSAKLPLNVLREASEMDQTVQTNANGLIDVLNNALHKSPDYFLYYDDPHSPYWRTLDTMCAARFQPLKPKADMIASSIRSALGLK